MRNKALSFLTWPMTLSPRLTRGKIKLAFMNQASTNTRMVVICAFLNIGKIALMMATAPVSLVVLPVLLWSLSTSGRAATNLPQLKDRPSASHCCPQRNWGRLGFWEWSKWYLTRGAFLLAIGQMKSSTMRFHSRHGKHLKIKIMSCLETANQDHFALSKSQ